MHFFSELWADALSRIQVSLITLLRLPVLSKVVPAALMRLGVECKSLQRHDTNARNDLSVMEFLPIEIRNAVGDCHSFSVWIARTAGERAAGLMNVGEEAIAPQEGMLFLYEHEQIVRMWMRNTMVPLDVAFITADGEIVRTRSLKARDEKRCSSILPVKFVLEVRDGEFAKRNIAAGARVNLPPTLHPNKQSIN